MRLVSPGCVFLVHVDLIKNEVDALYLLGTATSRYCYCYFVEVATRSGTSVLVLVQAKPIHRQHTMACFIT